MLVAITQDHIDQSYPRSCVDCAIARALESATGESWWVLDDCARLRWGERTYIDLPAEVKDFIRAFDAGEDVKPMVFEFKWEGKEAAA